LTSFYLGRSKLWKRKAMADISEYRVGVVLSVENSEVKGGKGVKICSIDVGDPSHQPLTVVTTAPNVREGSRVAVAPVGSTVITEQGEELKIQKIVVGGTMSEGMLCDSRMLGWTGGAAGIAVQIPESIAIGSPPPTIKPRPSDGKECGGDVPTGPVTEGLFAPKLSKEEKKKLAAEKRAAKLAAKEAK
jgi:tRNA-binding EMAP/Myf-like protein